ncbi:MAG TPA: LysM peptidoglycan-binding domain-containing protein, partial [Actinomycetota bacterium]|nr:LysM peptidoglycan-binding domain-containing protein [Actinomycetota bacterium]
MGDRVTEPYQPYESDESYEWDYDDRPRSGNKVLWGRIVALAIALFLAFLLGRTTAPKGIPESRLQSLQEQNEELQQENEDLQALLAQPESTPTDEGTPADETAEEPTAEGETYVVKNGDTLRGIAQTYCGDAQFDDLIAEANDIS